MPPALAAAHPPLDPPGVRAKAHGLLVRPYKRLSVSQAIRSSGVLVVPRMMAPAFLRRVTSGASSRATKPARSRVPASQRKTSTLNELLTLTGTPCNGP